MKKRLHYNPALRRPRGGDYRQMTLSIPAAIKRSMQRFLAVNWSEVATRAFADAVDKLERGLQP